MVLVDKTGLEPLANPELMKTNLAPILFAALFLTTARLPAAITGQWDFESGDLSATRGAPLSYLDTATQDGTQFGTTTSFSIPDINGQPAKVMRFPKMASSSMGYLMTHGAAPNGGGSLVNQWTLIIDVLYPTDSSGKWRSITQTDNSGDGDFFVNPGNGIGISGSYAGNVTGNTWHRIVFAVDVSAAQPVVSKYIDGVKVDDQGLGAGLDGRWALRPEMLFLNDEDGESEIGYLNSVQIRDTRLSDALVSLLGGPSAAGIPTTELPAHPYVDSITPANGAIGVAPDTTIIARIADGELGVTPGSVQLKLNGASVVPTVTKDGMMTTVNYQPPSPLPNASANQVTLIYSDSSGSFTNTWSFTVKPLDQSPSITGQWDFDGGSLAGTIGQPLEYLDGPGGTTQAGTQFGTTTSFGIPDIQGIPAAVMRFPGASTRSIGYIMRHDAVPNGGGSKVNQWTLIMDIMIPHQNSEPWFSFVQIDNLGNNGDGELFANFSGNSAGIGIGGQYGGAVTINAGQWHRVAFSVDMTGGNPVISKFIDGIKHSDQARSAPQLDSRHTLFPYALLFADEDGESQPAYVNSIQIRNYKMKDGELAALGEPSPYGIPAVSGQWDFNAADLSATIGSDMIARNPDMFFTQFDTSTINGQDANVMNFSGITTEDGYLIWHGALPNGGGAYVNQYTLIMDIMYQTGGFRALWQTATNNNNDADLFVNGSNGIGISSLYHGNLEPDVWHRVAFTFDLTKRELGKFIDGRNVLSGPVGSSPGTGPYQYLSSGIDGRFSLDPGALLFADEDEELNAGLVNSIQFRVGVLSPSQIAQLGGPSAAGIPANVPVPPRLQYVMDFGAMVISWPMSFQGFVLEGSPALGPGAVWSPVDGVIDNSVAIETVGQQFFRLRQP
jgi:hypothetical protein